MKLLICVNILTIISAIRVPISRTDANRHSRIRQINQRSVINPNSNINRNELRQQVVSNDGWVPIVPVRTRTIRQQNVFTPKVHNQVPTINQPTVIKRLSPQPQLYYSKQKYHPKKYIHSKSIRAIQQPHIVYNPFRENVPQKQRHRKRPSTINGQHIPHQIFPVNVQQTPNFNANTPSPSNSQQTVSSINNFFKNFNVDQFLPSRQPEEIHGPNIAARSRSFENFHVEPVLNNQGNSFSNHKNQHSPLGNHAKFQNFQNPVFKNYRDDRTHEPQHFDPNYDTSKIPTVHRTNQERAPISSHEIPQDIPTKPIYPGEGKWAKPGIKHKPFISNHQYEVLPETETPPDGYETFTQGEKLFNDQRNKFSDNLNNFPKQQNLGEFLNQEDYKTVAKQALNDNRQPESSPEQKITEETFVPTKLYAQVRNSENEEHLPPEQGENGRLKEAIKDSKVQTVYTEEGYEDSAYDHAGHEKKAHNDEGFEEFDRDLEKKDKEKQVERKKKLRPVPEKKSHKNKFLTDEEIEKDKEESLKFPEDSEIDGSEHIEISKLNALGKPPKKARKTKNPNNKSNGFITTKETKTTTKKKKENGNLETETNGEVRMILQPNNTSKYHQFVKKYPTVHKIINQSDNSRTPQDGNVTKKSSSTIRSDTINPTEIYIEEVFNPTIPTTHSTEIVTAQLERLNKKNDKIDSEKTQQAKIPTSLDMIDEAYSKNSQKSRNKRSADYLPNISVDTDFIDKISHELGKPKKDTTANKYPYYHNYKTMNLNENSPLRYSEDMANIPVKKEGKMAFYDQAENRIICPEVASTVEPIPDRVLNAEEETNEENEDDEQENYEEDDVDDTTTRRKRELNTESENLPRLRGLGDKIDCLKVKYFGENPLDSPIFKENSVGAVKPIFTFSKNVNTKNDQTILSTISSEEYQFNDKKKMLPNNNIINKANISDSLNGHNEINNSKNILLDNVSEASKVVSTTTMINLITTPKYTIALKPKNIYDQIQLLDYLPEEEINTETNKTQENEIDRNLTTKDKNFTTRSTIEKKSKDVGNNTSKDIIKKYTYSRNPKQLTENTTSNGNEILPEAEQLNRPRRIRVKPKRPTFQIFDVNKFLPTTQATFPIPSRQPPPVTQPVRNIYLPKPTYQVFDVNKFLPKTTPIPVISPSTVLPKYQVISEVFYKDNIKPNEQLNVFTDVLNNIKTASEEQIENSVSDNSKITEVKTPPNAMKDSDLTKTLKKKKNDDSYLQAYKDQEVDANYYSSIITSTTLRPIIIVARPHQPKTPNKNQPSIYLIPHLPQNKNIEDKKHRLYVALKKAAKKQKLTTTTTSELPSTTLETTSKRSHKNNHKNKPVEIMGLVPPKLRRYKTTYNPKRDNGQSLANLGEPQEKLINKFLVIGMLPPPKQTLYVYSDFINNNLENKYNRRRIKRSSSRQSYAQVSRGNRKHETTTEKPNNADDDYTPHRSKNYYYDEKLGKIVYLHPKNNKNDEEEEEFEEEIVYETVEATTEKVVTTPKQNPIFATATPPPAGQSFVDFVNILKNAANYQEIPDPVTTEQSKQINQIITTTSKPISTTPPEFLNILAQVRSNNEYKFIEDEKEKSKSASAKKPLKDEAENEEEEEEDEELEEINENKNVQNSAGKQIHEIGNNFEIFDITGYIPKIKNYLPKTAIDTSKYQTIRRPNKVNSESQEEKDKRHDTVINNPDSDVNDSTNAPTNIKENVHADQISSTTNDKIETTTLKAIGDSTPHSALDAARARIATRVRGRTSNRVRTTSTTTTTTNSPRVVTEHSTNKPGTRRRINRLRSRPTTEKFIFEEPNNTVKIVRRRSDSKINTYSSNNIPINDKSETYNNDNKVNNKVLKSTDGNKNKEESVSIPTDVKVFKTHDASSKHGGNYRIAEEDSVKENSKLLESNEFKSPTGKTADVEIIREFDKNKKHGGNYRLLTDSSRENDANANVDNENNPDVEIINAYSTNKKHGGNYKDEDENFSSSTNNDDSQQNTNTTDNKDSIGDVSLEKPVKVNVWNSDNEDKQEWSSIQANGKPDNGDIKSKLKNSTIKRRRPSRRPTKKHNQRENQIYRLTDVVPKPEAFYTDPNLPLAVNLLVDSLNVPTEEAEEIATISEDISDHGDDVNVAQKRQTNVYVTTTTKKPLFIKDPSKRLYFYAPI